MLVGVVGTVLPALPGLLLVWAAGVGWVWLDGGGAVRIGVAVALTLLLVLGTVAKYVLAGRAGRGAGAPRRTLVLAAAAAVVGFFAVPVVGFVVFGVGALYLAELARLGDRGRAWRSTLAALQALGVGVLVEVAAGLAMVAVWASAALATQ